MWEASLQSGGCKGTGSLDHSLTEAPEVGTKHPWRGGGDLATLGRSLQPGRFICLFFQNKTKNHHSKYLRRVLSSITVKSFM